jgi:hypothetical protein
MHTEITTAVLAAMLSFLPGAVALAQSSKQGEQLIRDQEKRLGVSCKSVHPKAHQFIKSTVAPLAERSSAALPLEPRFATATREAKELADQTLKCYGLEPIALHSRMPFESDFGELHEVLRHAAELIESAGSKEPETVRSFRLKELQKRMHELKTGSGRRYPAR